MVVFPDLKKEAECSLKHRHVVKTVHSPTQKVTVYILSYPEVVYPNQNPVLKCNLEAKIVQIRKLQMKHN